MKHVPPFFSLLATAFFGCAPHPVQVLNFTAELDDACQICGTATLSLDSPSSGILYLSTKGSQPQPWVRLSTAQEHTIPLLQMRAETSYQLHVQLEDESSSQTPTITLQTGPLPDDLPPIHLTVAPSEYRDELTVFPVGEWKEKGSSNINYVVAVDGAGEVVWYHRLDGIALGLDVDERGRVYTTETNQTLVRLDPFQQTSEAWQTADLNLDSVHHEVRSLSENGLALLSSELRAVSGWTDDTGDEVSYNIVGDVLITLDDAGKTTWRWSLLDHIDPLDRYTADLHNPFWQTGEPYSSILTPKDWSHGNAMLPNGEGWLASFRNLDWLIQINATTDEIDWILGPEGDFELAEGSRWFSRQHAPEVLPNGNLLLYDNGNERADAEVGELPWTRVVEYALDHENHTVTEVWSYAGGARYLCPVVGDVNALLNGNRLITDGALLTGRMGDDGIPIPHFSARIREVTDDIAPTLIWELQVGYLEDLETPSFFVYRAVRLDSLYPSYTHP